MANRSRREKILENIKIEKIGYGGVGISTREDGKKILIKWGALPGSVVDVRVVKQKKDFLQTHIVNVKSYDPKYTTNKPLCPHFFAPGAEPSGLPKHKIGSGDCKWQMIPYPQQLELKQAIVADAFKKIAKEQSFEMLPIVASPEQIGYRNKIEFSFGVYISQKDEVHANWQLGFHKQGEFSKIVDMDSTILISERANKLYAYLKKIFKDSGLPTYDQKTHKGFFRHLVMREGVNTGQMLINLSVSTEKLDTLEQKEQREKLQKVLLRDEYLQDEITTFVITENNGLADIVRGKDSTTRTLRGDGVIYEKLVFDNAIDVIPAEAGIQENDEDSRICEDDNKKFEKWNTESTFRVSPFSFFQTNTHGAEKLFYTAANTVGNIKGNILDLYCGAGSIGISFLKLGLGEKTVGVEIVEEAIIDAKHNAKINSIAEQCEFFSGPSEKFMTKEFITWPHCQDLGLVIIDPPREGLHPKVVDMIAQLSEQQTFKLLYISCNPITMARDVELFNEKWFNLKSLQAVDMFPHTHHIECIGLLKK